MLNSLLQSLTLAKAFSMLLDIGVVTVLFYCLFMTIQGTRAVQLIKGLVILVLVVALSNWLQLHALSWLLNQLWAASLVALAVIFQPELRRALEQIGRSRLYIKPFIENTDTDLQNVHEAVIKAAVEESKHNVGMLLVLEREIGLNDYVAIEFWRPPAFYLFPTIQIWICLSARGIAQALVYQRFLTPWW